MNPVPLPEFQMAPLLKFATSSRSKKKEPRYACQKKPLKVPSKGAPLHVPSTGSLWREMLRLQSHWFIHSFRSVGVSKKEPFHKMRGKHTVTLQGAPRGRKAYIQWGAASFPKGIIYDTAISTPVPCSLHRDTFHLGLGRPELRYPACVVVALFRVYVHSTHVTASHVTQSKVAIHVTLK
jgi:hypothetical protein